jgi:hypothetical protein
MRSPELVTRVCERMTGPVATTHPESPVTAAADLCAGASFATCLSSMGAATGGTATDRDLRQIVFRPAVRDRLRTSASYSER